MTKLLFRRMTKRHAYLIDMYYFIHIRLVCMDTHLGLLLHLTVATFP